MCYIQSVVFLNCMGCVRKQNADVFDCLWFLSFFSISCHVLCIWRCYFSLKLFYKYVISKTCIGMHTIRLLCLILSFVNVFYSFPQFFSILLHFTKHTISLIQKKHLQTFPCVSVCYNEWWSGRSVLFLMFKLRVCGCYQRWKAAVVIFSLYTDTHCSGQRYPL